jgi:hypothetical protein
MTDPNIRCSTGELPRRVTTSQRTRQRNLTGRVMTENARGNLQSNHDYRCFEIMGGNLKKVFDRNGISKRIERVTAAKEAVLKHAQEEAEKAASDTASEKSE